MSADAKTRILLKNLAPLREHAESHEDRQRLDRAAAGAVRRIQALELPAREKRTAAER